MRVRNYGRSTNREWKVMENPPHRDGGRLWQLVGPELDGTAQELILIRQLF